MDWQASQMRQLIQRAADSRANRPRLPLRHLHLPGGWSHGLAALSRLRLRGDRPVGAGRRPGMSCRPMRRVRVAVEAGLDLLPCRRCDVCGRIWRYWAWEARRLRWSVCNRVCKGRLAGQRRKEA